jgi:two-component system, NtrC family, sensor kinase
LTYLKQTVAELEQRLQASLAERDELLLQQAATAEILEIINSTPGNLAPVFGAILEKAMFLCGASFGALSISHGHDMHQVVATRGMPSEFAKLFEGRPTRLGPETGIGRLVRGESFVHIADAADDEAYRLGNPVRRALVDIAGARTYLAVPLRRDEVMIGAFTIYRREVRLFTEKQIALLQTFADQAVIAIENARLFDEVQAKTRDLSEALQQQTATADVLKVISRSTFDLQTVLETLIKSAVELSGANRGSIFLREGDVFPLKAASSTTPEFVQYWAANPPKAGRGSATSRVIGSGEVEIIPDVLEDPEMEMPPNSLIRIRATLGVPMLRDNKVEGVLVLTRPEPGPFTKSQIDLVQTFADQAVIAVENVRLFQETKARTKELAASLEELRAAQDRLVQTEKLASLGQLTAGIAHEIKNPLNFVNNFSVLSAELVGEMNDVLAKATLDATTRGELDELTQILKSNLEKVVQHGKRADSIVKNMLQHSREGSGEHRPADINATVEESLNLAYHGARAEKAGFSIAFQRDLDPSVGMADVYPQEITRVLLNLISNGFYAVAKRKADAGDGFEPILSASTKNLGDKIEIRIRDNGAGIPDEIKDKIFNPFFTTKPSGEGTGLGLSMSYDIIVKQHGGSIDVETEPGFFTEFKIVLPRKSQR